MFETLMLTLRTGLSEHPRLVAVAPAVPVLLWFLGGLLVYQLRVLAHGEHTDEDLEAKGTSPILGLGIRRYFSWVTRPLWSLVERSGLPANGVTTLAALIGLGSGIAFAGGSLVLGGWLYILSGILDVFDGRLARLRGTSGPAGAVLDSVLDRYVDAATLGGLAWLYRDTWVLIPCLLALAGAATVSYIRAKGEGLGLRMNFGVMQRPERVLCLGAATVLSPVFTFGVVGQAVPTGDVLAIAGLCVLAVSSQWTAAQRLFFVLKKLAPRPSPAALASGSVFRATAVSLAATGADFYLVHRLVEGAYGLSPWVATALGCLVGAVVGFTLGRVWGFTPARESSGRQFKRYLFVSGLGLALNAGGVALFASLPELDYQIAWALVRGAVFMGWSYPLQREFVFRHRTSTPSAREASDGVLAKGATL